jgi:hypothetical protein
MTIHDLPQNHPPSQGSPQHSFNVYCSTCCSICCFADDSSYSYSSKDSDDIKEQISEKYNTILDTQAEIIEPSKCKKLLGCIIGQNLKFTEHIQNSDESMLRTLNKRLNGLKKVSKNTRKMVANGIILSKILYLIPLWSGCESYLLNSLQIIQNKAARVVTKCGKRTPIKSLLSQYGWLSVAQLSVYHSLLLMYKILSTKSPLYLHTKLTGVQEAKHYETRFVLNRKRNQSFILDKESQAGCDIAKKSFKYRATSQWNTLPVNIREEQTLKKFKINQLNTLLSYIVKKVFL